MLFETGHPWITFKDPCNVRSPQDHVGVIHCSATSAPRSRSTPPTTRPPSATSAPSSSTPTSRRDGALDHEKLRETIRVAVRALDNVIDINFYPTDAAKTANTPPPPHRPRRHGPRRTPSTSATSPSPREDAVEFNDEFMEAIAYYAYEASSDLAAERGTYSSYKGSQVGPRPPPAGHRRPPRARARRARSTSPAAARWTGPPVREKIAKHGMRNSNVLAIAPTATISNIMGTTPCIEPNYKNLYVKSNLSGDFIVLNRYLVKRPQEGAASGTRKCSTSSSTSTASWTTSTTSRTTSRHKYLTAFGIDFEYIIDAAARRQKWIDQSPEREPLPRHPRHEDPLATCIAAPGTPASRPPTTSAPSRLQHRESHHRRQKGTTRRHGHPNRRHRRRAKQYTDAEKNACSIDAMLNGGTCEACQ